MFTTHSYIDTAALGTIVKWHIIVLLRFWRTFMLWFVICVSYLRKCKKVYSLMLLYKDIVVRHPLWFESVGCPDESKNSVTKCHPSQSLFSFLSFGFSIWSQLFVLSLNNNPLNGQHIRVIWVNNWLTELSKFCFLLFLTIIYEASLERQS